MYIRKEQWLLREGFIPILVEDQDSALRQLGASDHKRREILADLEDSSSKALWVNFEVGHMAIETLGVE